MIITAQSFLSNNISHVMKGLLEAQLLSRHQRLTFGKFSFFVHISLILILIVDRFLMAYFRGFFRGGVVEFYVIIRELASVVLVF